MKLLVSACLAGQACRYDGKSRVNPLICRLVGRGIAVPVCPETEGGLAIPRPPSEIAGGSGRDVWAGSAKVLTRDGLDVTEHFMNGARRVLEVACRNGAFAAVFVERSPSCGVESIYDGTFSGSIRHGEGVATALLRKNGFEVISPDWLDELTRLNEWPGSDTLD